MNVGSNYLSSTVENCHKFCLGVGGGKKEFEIEIVEIYGLNKVKEALVMI